MAWTVPPSFVENGPKLRVLIPLPPTKHKWIWTFYGQTRIGTPECFWNSKIKNSNVFWHDPPQLPKVSIIIFCTLSISFQQTVHKRSTSAYVSSWSNWGFPTIPLHILTLQKIWAEIFRDTFQYFKENVKITIIKNDVKYVFFFRFKARVGNCTLVSVWHPFEIVYEFVQPHHNHPSNIFHPK